MIAMKALVVSMGLLLIGLCPALLTAEWGKPLGGAYDGPEGKPRVVTPAPAELGLHREYGDSTRPLVIQSL
jgi:hypothetical protein